MRIWDFAPVEGREQASDGLYSATVLLRPTAPHPDLSNVLTGSTRDAIHLKLARDQDGKPVDALHIHAHASRESTRQVEEALWSDIDMQKPLPDSLGVIDGKIRSEPLAVVQLLLLYHLFMAHQMLQGDNTPPGDRQRADAAPGQPG